MEEFGDLKWNSFSDGPLWKISSLWCSHTTVLQVPEGLGIMPWVLWASLMKKLIPAIGKGFSAISYQVRNSHFSTGHLDVSKKNTGTPKWQFELHAWPECITVAKEKWGQGIGGPSPLFSPFTAGEGTQVWWICPSSVGERICQISLFQKDPSPCNVIGSAIHTPGLYWLEKGAHLPDALELREWRRILSVLVWEGGDEGEKNSILGNNDTWTNFDAL